MAFYQGELDGLCGMYAIANALQLCDEDVDAKDVIKTACSGLAQSAWPDVLFSGTTLRQMQIMLKKVATEFSGFRVTYPFLRNQPSSNDKYWQAFDSFFEDPQAVCAIVGVTSEKHWTVISPDGGRIEVTDSTAFEQYAWKNRKSFHAGQRRKNDRQMLLDKQEIIVFYVTNE